MTLNATDGPPTSDSTVFLETKIAEDIWKHCSLVLLIIGTVGNVLAICVLLRRTMRSSTTMFYLTAMAFADLFVLYTGLFRYWIKNMYSIDVRHLSQSSCRAHIFLVYFSLDIAVWTMVVVTVDRAIFVCAPFRAKFLCNIRKARFTLVILTIFITIVNIHFLWMMDLVEINDGSLDCILSLSVSPKQFWYAKAFHPWLDFCMYSFVPFFVMLVCNILIIREMALSRRRLSAHFKREKQRITEGKIPTISQSTRIKRKRQSPHCTSVTVTLLTVNIVFLFTTSPIVTFLLGHDTWFNVSGPHGKATLSLIWAIVNMLQYLNNSIHFFLYCLTGPKFRREILAMFSRKNRIGTIIEPSTMLEVYHNRSGIRDQQHQHVQN